MILKIPGIIEYNKKLVLVCIRNLWNLVLLDMECMKMKNTK